MTVGVNINPAFDVYNGGWAVHGANTSLWATLSSAVDTNYISSPFSKERAIVAPPQDSTAVPSSADIKSVSLVVRASLGAGSPVSGSPPSLTCGIMSAGDNTQSKQRTIYPTNSSASPQNFTVATWSHDASGDSWDINSLNDTWIEVFSSNQVVDLIRIYEAYLVVNYSGAPLVTVNAPTGTVTTASPTVSWTFTQSEGDRQASAEYLVYTTSQVVDPTFIPDGDGSGPTFAPILVGGVKGPATSVTMAGSLPSGDYWVYVQAESVKGVISNWGTKQFTVYTPYPGTPAIQGPAGSPGTQGIASLVPDDDAGCAVITVQDTSNLLGRHMSDVNIEDSDQAWVTSNCTIASSTDFTFPGSIDQVWKITCTSAGNISVTTGHVPVTAVGGQLTAVAQALAGSTGRSITVIITYLDSNYTALSQVVGIATSDSAVWTQVGVVDPNIPSGVAKAQATFQINGCALNEVHYITHAGLLYGNSTQWSNGGMVSRNILDSWYSNNSGTAPAGDSWVPATGTTVSSAAAPTNAGYDGNNVNTMTCSSVAPSISLHSTGTVFSTATAGTSFTLNKPGTLSTGDLMLAFVTATSGQTGFAAPTGWTLIDTANASGSSGAITLIVMARTATNSEPSTWAGTLAASSARCSAVVVAYSGAASVTSQFIAEAESAKAVAGTVFTTPTVANTDPGAWRVSAFATDTTGSSATMTANTQGPGGNPIQYVSSASWGTINTSGSYTINRPAGVVSGDLMIAVVTADVQGGISINAPSGWTVVRSVSGSGAWTAATVVLKRTAGGSEPATWTGTTSGTPGGVFQKASSCAAYRNAAPASSQFVADNYATAGVGYPTLWSPSVANTNANAWAVGAFSTLNDGSDGQNVLSARSSSGLNMQQRASESFNPGNEEDVICTLIEDSGAPVAPGSYAASAGANVWTASAFAWIGYILPATPGSPPSNETSRVSNTAGSGNPFDNLAVFDSNAAVAVGPQSVSATSSATFAAAAGWIGLLKPSSSSTGGLVAVSLNDPVDLSSAQLALAAAGGEVVIGATIIGSSGGTLLVTAEFFRANVSISTLTQPGGPFQSTSGGVYQDCFAQFDVPDGTTRIGMQLSVAGRNVGDVVYWNRSFMNLGSDPSFVPGSSAAAHPIWSYPEIQYAQDDGSGGGFGPWSDVPGTKTNLPAFGNGRYLVLRDHTIVPLLSRKYRARTVSYGLNGDTFVSAWGPDSVPMTFTASNWWLKDIDNPDNNIALKVKAQDMPIVRQSSTVQFQGLGDPYPVVMTDGYKSELIQVSMIPVNQEDHAMLMALLTSGKTMFLQSDIDQAWWVQTLGDIKNVVLNTGQRQSNPLRQLDVTFLEVAPVP